MNIWCFLNSGNIDITEAGLLILEFGGIVSSIGCGRGCNTLNGGLSDTDLW